MEVNDIALFENVKTSDLKYNLNNFVKNQTVYNRGEECEAIDVLINGELVAYSLSQNGNENIVFNFNKGSIIGANLLFGNINRYPLTIYCTSDCKLMSISKDEVCKLLKNSNFAMNFIKNLSLNSQGMNTKIAMSAGKSLRENIIDYLTALSVEQKSNTVLLPMSKKQLADYFGVQRPSLFRELKRMKDEELIESKNKQVVLRFP